MHTSDVERGTGFQFPDWRRYAQNLVFRPPRSWPLPGTCPFIRLHIQVTATFRGGTARRWRRFWVVLDTAEADRSIDLGFVAVHDFVARGFDPFIDLLHRHDAFLVKPIPAHDLIQRLLPPFVGWPCRWAKAHDINDRQFLRNAEKWLDLALDILLPNGGDPPNC